MNKRFLEYFPEPKILLNVIQRADPAEIDEVITFVDGIIDKSNQEKDEILTCRAEKQAFVDAAVVARTTETEEHTKVNAELTEARENVKDYETNEEEKKILENNRKVDYDKAVNDVKACEAEVDKTRKESEEQSAIYQQIIDLLKQCDDSKRTDWTLGPRVDNNQYKKCSSTFASFKDAQVACLGDKSCGWLHDYNCDDTKWRWCASSVTRTTGDKKACSFVRGRTSTTTTTTTTTTTSSSSVVIVPAPLKDDFETKWGLDGWQGFSEVNTGYKITIDGSISQWEYVAGSNSGVTLQVWRFVSGTKYTLIGQNTVSSSVKGKNMVVKIELKDQIKVKKDDFIGWTFIGQAAFGFSSTQGTTRWSTGNGVAYNTIGGEFDFPGTGKRLYQCRASVSPTETSTTSSSTSTSTSTTTSTSTSTSTTTSTSTSTAVLPSPLESSFEDKWGLDGWQGFSEVNTGFKIPADGTLSKWEYLAGSKSGVVLQVWRFVSGTDYKLIGQNTVDKSIKGKTTVVNVKAENQIEVKKNDFIGWTFIGQAAFGFSSSQGTTRWSTGNGVAYQTVGKQFSFPGSGRRLYQIRATVSITTTTTSSSETVVPAPLKDSFETDLGRKLSVDSWKDFSEINTGYKIPFDGKITKWEYLAGSKNGVVLQIWRRVGSTTDYELIGQNTVQTSTKGKTEVVNVKSANQIKVQKDDFIGWTFTGEAAFGFSGTQGVTRWSTGNGVGYTTVGKKFSFPGSGKRLYQLRAYVSPVVSLIAIKSQTAINRTFI